MIILNDHVKVAFISDVFDITSFRKMKVYEKNVINGMTISQKIVLPFQTHSFV